MQEFIVTGRMPGTDLVITFKGLVIVASLILMALMIWQIYQVFIKEVSDKINSHNVSDTNVTEPTGSEIVINQTYHQA